MRRVRKPKTWPTSLRSFVTQAGLFTTIFKIPSHPCPMSPFHLLRKLYYPDSSFVESKCDLRLSLAKHSSLLRIGLIMQDLRANYALGFQSIPNFNVHTNTLIKDSKEKEEMHRGLPGYSRDIKSQNNQNLSLQIKLLQNTGSSEHQDSRINFKAPSYMMS